jgi:hypothetical protein
VLGYITIEQNDLFKVLTIASVVGIPPTVIAGIWGMNFEFMPELHSQWGYPLALLTIVLSVVAPLIWFKARGWFWQHVDAATELSLIDATIVQPVKRAAIDLMKAFTEPEGSGEIKRSKVLTRLQLRHRWGLPPCLMTPAIPMKADLDGAQGSLGSGLVDGKSI